MTFNILLILLLNATGKRLDLGCHLRIQNQRVVLQINFFEKSQINNQDRNKIRKAKQRLLM